MYKPDPYETVRDDLAQLLALVEEHSPRGATYPDLEAVLRIARREAQRVVEGRERAARVAEDGVDRSCLI